MLCDTCGTEGTKIRRITRSYGKGENLLVIENIPVISCPHCGANYMTAPTLTEIARIKKNREKLVVARSVEVATYSQLAVLV